MMQTASVTVVVPVFNAKGVIEHALASVLRNRPVPEIIVVDDGSLDGSYDAALSFLETNRAAGKVIRLESNAGPAAARNRGWREAQSDWVAFLDADDEWREGKLTLQMELAKKNSAVDLWCGGVSHELLPALPTDEASWEEIYLKDFATGNPVTTSSVIVKREILSMVGGFDESFRGPEDYELWIRIAAEHRLGMISTPLVRRTESPLGLSSDERTFLPEALRVLDKAFGKGGAFETHQEWRGAALANQYWNASWMAFGRGARLSALRMVVRAWLWQRGSVLKVERKWLSLALRYLVGPAPWQGGKT